MTLTLCFIAILNDENRPEMFCDIEAETPRYGRPGAMDGRLIHRERRPEFGCQPTRAGFRHDGGWPIDDVTEAGDVVDLEPLVVVEEYGVFAARCTEDEERLLVTGQVRLLHSDPTDGRYWHANWGDFVRTP